jgi:hypothetical protein
MPTPDALPPLKDRILEALEQLPMFVAADDLTANLGEGDDIAKVRSALSTLWKAGKLLKHAEHTTYALAKYGEGGVAFVDASAATRSARCQYLGTQIAGYMKRYITSIAPDVDFKEFEAKVFAATEFAYKAAETVHGKKAMLDDTAHSPSSIIS